MPDPRGAEAMSGYYDRQGNPVDQAAMIAIYNGDFDTERRIDNTTVDGAEVSTVFLVMNHAYGDGPPLIFETMVFGGDYDQWCYRYATEDEARAGHDAAVAWLRGEGDEPGLSLASPRTLLSPEEENDG